MYYLSHLSLSLCAMLLLCLGQTHLSAEEADADKPEAEQQEKKKKKQTKLSNTGGTLTAIDKEKMTITISVPTEGDQAPIGITLTCNEETRIKQGKNTVALADLPLNCMISAKYNPETKTATSIRCKVKREKKPKEEGDIPKKEKKPKEPKPEEGDM